MTDVTRILSAIEQGDPQAAEQLLPLVYDELRKLAAQKLAQEKPGQTLQATALVHEAYLRLVGADRAQALGQPRPLLRRGGRGHAPHPRRERPAQEDAQKRGGDRRARRPRRPRARSTPADPGRAPGPRRGPRPARPARTREGRELVKLRYFAGLTVEEAADVARDLPRHGRPALGLRPGLAPRAGSTGGE